MNTKSESRSFERKTQKKERLNNRDMKEERWKKF